MQRKRRRTSSVQTRAKAKAKGLTKRIKVQPKEEAKEEAKEEKERTEEEVLEEEELGVKTLVARRKHRDLALRKLVLPKLEDLLRQESPLFEKCESIEDLHKEVARVVNEFVFEPQPITHQLQSALTVEERLKTGSKNHFFDPCKGAFSKHTNPWPAVVECTGVALVGKPGIGKTRIAAMVVAEHSSTSKHVLIVCPDGLVEHWREEVRCELRKRAQACKTEPTEPLVITDGVSYNRLRVPQSRFTRSIVLIVAASFMNRPCYKSYAGLRKGGENHNQSKQAWVTLRKMEQTLREVERERGYAHPTVRFATACGIELLHHAQAIASVIKTQSFKKDPRAVLKLANALRSATLVPKPSAFEQGVWENEFDVLVSEYIEIEKVHWSLSVMDEPVATCYEGFAPTKPATRKLAVREAFSSLNCKKLVLTRTTERDTALLLELIGARANDHFLCESLTTDSLSLTRRLISLALLKQCTVDCALFGEAGQGGLSNEWATYQEVKLDPEPVMDYPVSAELSGELTVARLAADARRARHGLHTVDQKTLVAIIEDAADKVRAELASAIVRDTKYLIEYRNVLVKQHSLLQKQDGDFLSPELILTQLSHLDDLNLTMEQVARRIASTKNTLSKTVCRDTLQLHLAIFGEAARSEMQCSVCQDPDAKDLLVTNCAHAFCDGCLGGWRTSGEPRADCCPICRERVLAVCTAPSKSTKDPSSLKELNYRLTLQNFGAKIAWLEQELDQEARGPLHVLVVCWCESSAQAVASALRKTCGWKVQRSIARGCQDSAITVLNAGVQAWNLDLPDIDWLVMMSPRPDKLPDPTDWVLRARRTKPIRITTLDLKAHTNKEEAEEGEDEDDGQASPILC